MVIIQARMGDGRPGGRTSMSIVLDNGDIHHFFALPDGVHHSSTDGFHGRYAAAVNRELARPGAEIVATDSSILRFERPESVEPEPLAS